MSTRQFIVFINIIFLLFVVVGCSPPPSIIKTANTTQPVLVGKVKNIEGEIVDKNKMQQSNRFSASLKNSLEVYSVGYVSGWKELTEGSNKIDAQLLPIVDVAALDSTKVIMVDRIRFNCWATYLLFYLGVSNRGWLEGAIYKENSN